MRLFYQAERDPEWVWMFPNSILILKTECFLIMLNINYGCNIELLDACKPLSEYSWEVDTEGRHRKKLCRQKKQ